VIALETFRLRFQSTLARGLAAPEVARRAGLAAASEVWGGAAPRELPAWYLWLAGRRGAWQVELAEARLLEDARSAAGRFTVRHYPAPDDPRLASFDPEERAAAAAWLDGTGTPRIDAGSAIGARLFAVGVLEWAVDLEGDTSVLVLTSQDRLRSRRDGRRVRDVPGWALAREVFSTIAALHAQVERRVAVQLVVARQPGFELVEDGDAPGPHDTADVTGGEALLAFGAPGGCGSAARRLLRALRDEGGELVADESLEPAGAGRAVGAAAGLELEIAPAWFGGEAHQAVSACAC
jgi:hypothetical protein